MQFITITSCFTFYDHGSVIDFGRIIAVLFVAVAVAFIVSEKRYVTYFSPRVSERKIRAKN